MPAPPRTPLPAQKYSPAAYVGVARETPMLLPTARSLPSDGVLSTCALLAPGALGFHQAIVVDPPPST